MPSLLTTDSVRIVYDVRGSGELQPLVLVHGWSGSRLYFQRNVGALAQDFTVINYDQRFHGDSGKPEHGFHVARLAADLHELLEALNLTDCVLLGTSMVRHQGAASEYASGSICAVQLRASNIWCKHRRGARKSCGRMACRLHDSVLTLHMQMASDEEAALSLSLQ
jgi:alpha/beta hydrolase fold